MSFGAAASLRIIAACLTFLAQFINAAADFLQLVGDPALSHTAVAAFGCFVYTGHWGKAVASVLAFALWELISAELAEFVPTEDAVPRVTFVEE